MSLYALHVLCMHPIWNTAVLAILVTAQVFRCSCSVSKAITVTEQMVGGSADTLQLCTLPLELLLTSYTVPLLTLLSLFFSHTFVAVAVVFVSTYKKQYEKFHKLDVAMILSLVFIFGGFLVNATDERPYAFSICIGFIFSILFSLPPLVYFTIKFCLSIKHVLVQKLSAGHCMSCPPSRRQRGDYEDLSNIKFQSAK